MLPGENDIRGQVQETMHEDIDRLSRLLRFALDVLLERHPTKLDESEDWQFPYRAGHGLCFKACKSLRSTIALGELGIDHDTTLIQRTLFETALAVHFVLRPEIELGLKGVNDADLTVVYRAKLYLAYLSIRRYDELIKFQSGLETSGLFGSVDYRPFRQDSLEAIAAVGQEWTDRFRNHPRTYCGVSVRKLCTQLGRPFDTWYNTIYAEQCKASHATDSTNMLFSTSTPNDGWLAGIPNLNTYRGR